MADTIRLFVLSPQKGEIQELPLPPSAQSLDEVTSNLPSGPYTTFRTYQGDRFYRLEAHLARLEISARHLGQPFIFDHNRVRLGIQEILKVTRFDETRFRVTIPFQGQKLPGDIYFAVTPFVSLDPHLYETGVNCLLHRGGRENPLAKSSDFIQKTQSLRSQIWQSQSIDAINEILMVDDQEYILEGLSSNFFGILEDQGVDRLYTAATGVLEGISRALVLQVAPEILPVELAAIQVSQLPSLEEAFITSSSRDILPVVRIEHITIGAGKPGPKTRRLLSIYRQTLTQSVEPA